MEESEISQAQLLVLVDASCTLKANTAIPGFSGQPRLLVLCVICHWGTRLPRPKIHPVHSSLARELLDQYQK